jgi:hypothetical protein
MADRLPACIYTAITFSAFSRCLAFDSAEGGRALLVVDCAFDETIYVIHTISVMANASSTIQYLEPLAIC